MRVTGRSAIGERDKRSTRQVLCGIPLLLGLLAAFLFRSAAAETVTVNELREFLQSKQAARLADSALAERLNLVTLSERMTDAELREILRRISIGPQSAEQLALLAASSSVLEPSRSQQLQDPPADNAAQHRMIESATNYVSNTLERLPDFVATRLTRSFDNLPQVAASQHDKPRIRMHWSGLMHREIAFRQGHEIMQVASDSSGVEPGFASWGEFGPILKVVLTDSFQGGFVWSRWDWDSRGERVAVFRYTVPRQASHYSIDFCCYRESLEGEWISFKDKPPYRGEVYIRQDGEVARITLNAELPTSSAVRTSGVAVDYGPVEIGGKIYQCPLHSVAVSEIFNLSIQKIDGRGLERHLNVVDFEDYHKFGSTSHIIPSAQ